MVDAKQPLRVVVVLLVTLLGMATLCVAEQTPIFGGLSDSTPLSFEENGVATGLFTEVFLEAAKRAGFEVTVDLIPIKRLLVYAESGEIDGIVALRHRVEREKALIYSTSPIMTSRTLVFVKKGREIPFNGVHDLKGKTIGVLLGWKVGNAEFEQAIQDGTIQIDEAPGHVENLKKLMAGRIDCLFGTEQMTWYHANKLGITEYLVALEPPVTELSVFLAVSKHTKNIADPQAFIAAMDAALDEVHSDGTYEQLQKKYKVTALE